MSGSAGPWSTYSAEAINAIEAIAQKMLDFKSTVTSCLMWVTSCHARTLTLPMSDLKVNNNNQYGWFFGNELGV